MNAIKTDALDRARTIVEEAIAARVFPAAAVDVGSSEGSLWHDALGTLTFDAGAVPATSATLFDLASLTKVIATTTLVMDLVASGRLDLDEPVSSLFPEWRGIDREQAVVRDLLEHASGLPARLVDAPPGGRREFEHEICGIPLEYERRSRSLYSDLDFILLGFAIADRSGVPLAHRFRDVTDALGPDRAGLGFNPPDVVSRLAAPTMPLEDDRRRGRRLVGEVHDNYAAALGGAAGHAGLFGNAEGVGTFARIALQAARGVAGLPPPFSADLMRVFIAKSVVPGSSRALGWDTMLPTSSCGARMSATAFGHVGFTGTSLWIDPARDRYFVLLTNRVCGGGSSEELQAVRRAFHDALGDI